MDFWLNCDNMTALNCYQGSVSMKKILFPIFLGFFSCFASLALAATEPAKNTATSPTPVDSITLYRTSEAKEVLKRLPPNTRLVPIFQQGNWVKVGNPQDGTVGWIDLVQYQKAREAYYRPDIQTIYVHVDTSNNAKPVLNVVAYKNGQALSKDEAMKLYQRLRKQQEAQFQGMQKFSMNMEQMMNQDFLNAQRFFDSAWMNPPWMEPVILVPAPKANAANPAPAPTASVAAPAAAPKA